jgi:hypothetical protein
LTASIHTLSKPNPEAMRAHVEHLFGGYLDGYHDGLIELSWTDTQADEAGKHALKHARLFKTDQIDELLAEASRLNLQPMCNVYIGAALRKPETAPFGRAKDTDALCLTAAYIDLDDEGSVSFAQELYKDKKVKPTLVVVTGRAPHTRAQLWWRLDEPATDPEQWSALIKGMAASLRGDPTVSNPSRVMRLAGTIAWPVKEGRTVEMTQIVPLTEPGQRCYAFSHLAALFPPIYTVGGMSRPAQSPPVSGATSNLTHRTNSLGLPAEIMDGRETYMRDTLAAALIEYVGTTGAAPSAQELFDASWPQYERHVDLSRPGRGREEFARKCEYTVNRFLRGEIRGMPTLDAAIEIYKNKAQARRQAPQPAPQQAPEPVRQDKAIRTVDFLTLLTEEIKEEPDYISPDFAGPGTFALIAGPPKAQKSFLLQEILVAGATGGSFLNGTFKCERPLRIFYLQAEMNRKLLRRRARAFRLFSQAEKDLLARNLIISERFHMLLNDSGVATAVETIKAAFPSDPPDIIAIDPLANVFDQENESDNAQMMRFIQSRVEAVRQRINPLACIIMVHHATKKSSDDMSRDPFVAIRGAGALRGYYDSAIVIYRPNEETKQRKIHFELRSGESPEPMTVELKDGRFYKATPTSGVSKDDARKILKAIDEAWKANDPWSPHSRATNEGRHAATNASKQFGINPKVVQALIEDWLINRIVTFRQRERIGGKNAGYRPAGLQVIGSLD